nr:unnamed protein product [Callosobruchus analis]
MNFQENLILRVQNYNELYDLSGRYYSNQQRKQEVWREIAEQIGETIDACKEAWRELRDNYRKAKTLRKTKSGYGAKNIKSIKFEKELTFLNPYQQQPQELQTSNLSVSSSDGEADEDGADNSTQQLTEGLSEAATLYSVKSVSSASMSRLNSTINRKRENIQKSPVLEYLEFKRQQQVSQQPNSHPLDVFFSSMAAAVKTFPARVQLNIKQKVFQPVTDTEVTLMNSRPLQQDINAATPGPFVYD